jgi:beta-glucanase (GH16 family)
MLNDLFFIFSAKLTTINSFSFKYGRVEVRAKLPRGDWLWPAIWMLPATNSYGMWPASGEIDIMEGRGNVNYADEEGGLDSFGSTLHWGVDWSQNRFGLTHAVYKHPESLSEDFHIYGLVWTAERLYTYINDPENIVYEIDLTEQPFYQRGEFAESYDNPWQYSGNINAPFDQEYYLIINLAVGGTAGYFKEGVSGKPWSDKSSNSVNEFYRAKNQWFPTWTVRKQFLPRFYKLKNRGYRIPFG